MADAEGSSQRASSLQQQESSSPSQLPKGGGARPAAISSEQVIRRGCLLTPFLPTPVSYDSALPPQLTAGQPAP